MILRYLFYILQIMLICVFLAGFFVISQIDKKINKTLTMIQREKSDFQYVKIKLTELKREIEQKEVKIFSKERALKNLLDTANTFFKNYDAKILEDIKDEDKTLILKMSLAKIIKNKNDVKNLIEELNRYESLFIKIQKFEVKKDGEISSLNIVFSLIQVYKG